MSEPGRTLPHSLDAERSVLGAILIDNRALFVAMALIKPRDFFRKTHRWMFEAMLELSDKQIEIDLVTVREVLEREGQLEEVGVANLAALVDGVPHSTNVSHYASIVKEKAALRQAIAIGSKLIGMAYEAEPIDEVLKTGEELFFDLRGERVQGRIVPVREGLKELHTDLEWLQQHPGELVGLPTGFEKLDALTRGWQRGDMIIIAARPSMGKTVLAIDIAKAMAKAGRGRVAYFSMEMRRKQLERRLLANISGVQLTRILEGKLGSKDWAPIAQAEEEIAELPIWIDDTPARSVWDIRSVCRQMKAEDEGLSSVILDYIQLMGTGDDRRRRGDNRTQELTDISRRTKVLAGELDVPIIVLSQLVRLEPGERPRLHHLRESGALEQDSDVVAFIYGKNHQLSGPREFIIEKARNGPTGTVHLDLHREITRFFDAPDPPPEEPKPEADKPKRARKVKSPDRW